MTKWITILIIAVVLYGGWQLFLYYDRVKSEDEETQKKAAATENISPQQLSGMPNQLESSLDAAQKQGAAGLRNWLKVYGPSIQDPRKAWIQLDYCVDVSREDPAEARRVFAEVKGRTPDSSPVWKRIKQLEKTYE
jgi:hypothetical protein